MGVACTVPVQSPGHRSRKSLCFVLNNPNAEYHLDPCKVYAGDMIATPTPGLICFRREVDARRGYEGWEPHIPQQRVHDSEDALRSSRNLVRCFRTIRRYQTSEIGGGSGLGCVP